MFYKRIYVHPPLRAILNAWRFTIGDIDVHRNFFGSVQLLLDRADNDGGGGVDLRAVNTVGQTAFAFMSSLNPFVETKANLMWQQARSLLEVATIQEFEYGGKLWRQIIINFDYCVGSLACNQTTMCTHCIVFARFSINKTLVACQTLLAPFGPFIICLFKLFVLSPVVGLWISPRHRMLKMHQIRQVHQVRQTSKQNPTWIPSLIQIAKKPKP